jgi:hypothetical protein
LRAVVPAAVTDDVAREVLRDLRSARRRHYLRQLDWVDALYKAYLMAIGAGAATLAVSGALGDARASSHTVHTIAARGPAALGLLVALLVAGGLRTGARGGPLALQPPDVHQVLLAPVRRGLALRAPALSQLRGRVFAGAIAGAVVGNLAFRRLPGRPAAWIACGLGFGMLAAAAYMGAALIGSGLRVRRPLAAVLGLLVLAWSGADWAMHVTTSPATMLGKLAAAPLEPASAGLMAGAAAVALGLLVVGVARIGGTSLEHSLRRAGLVAQLRFAVTVQDLRAVILLRRQLAGELPRSRPWSSLPLRSSVGTLGATGWRRAWRSFLRWPAARAIRVVALGAIAGVSTWGAWRGTTPLIVVAGCALLLAALDAIEPLAQEIDHPTRRSLLPVPGRPLLRSLLVAPAAVLVLAGVAGVMVVSVPAADSQAAEVGLALVAPAALGALAGAAVSVITDPFQWVLIPALQNVRAAAPFVLATAGVLPVLAARYAVRHGQAAVGAAFQAGLFVALLAVGVLMILTGPLAPKDAA